MAKMGLDDRTLKFKQFRYNRNQNYQNDDQIKSRHGDHKKPFKGHIDSRFEDEILKTCAFKNPQRTRLSEILNEYLNSLDSGIGKNNEIKSLNDGYWW